MEKLQNLVASLTGKEKVGVLDTSPQSLYGKHLASCKAGAFIRD
jgi:hypothetical protein